MSTRRASRYETPFGAGLVWVSEGRLVAVELPEAGAIAADEAAADAEGSELAKASGPDRTALERWVSQLEAYFRGERLGWSLQEISLEALAFSPFAQAVCVALLSVPPGETVSYGELAEMAGYPRAARAVGNVMAANPIPVVVPCHRVIRADGSLGNYGDDPTWKGRLLEHERAGSRSS
jgi:methylated-DNA-[protein]-cysteine S-methyltransferase